MEKPELYRKRIANYLANVIAPAIYEDSEPLKVWAFQCADPIAYDEAITREFQPVDIGFRFGPKWSTVWFKVEGTVPERFQDRKVLLRFNCETEALLYRHGEPMQGMELNHDDHLLFRQGKSGDFVSMFIECGVNLLMGADGGSRYDSREPTSGPHAPAALKRCQLAVLNDTVRGLYYDISFLANLEKALPTQSPRRAQILRALNDAVNRIDPADLAATAGGAREILAPVLEAPAAASATQVYASGHAHIDLAWLWPVRETIRKGARTYSTQIMLMDEYPEYIFHASQAQLYAWVKERYPALFERLRERVKRGQWEAAGAMWVEADCNIVSGESLVRQILHGRNFWKREFAVEQSYLWLPDVFGYSAALPQILAQAGLKYFVTQKISWNEFNRFPHHTFRWRGIDGTSVLTHFLPADTYNGDNTPAQLLGAQERLLDADRAPLWLQAYGFGDGGGGPTREQIEYLKRAGNCDGLPRARFSRIDDFLCDLERDSRNLAVWSGELYLEYHRGTYTTQAKSKLYNRLCELQLREAELWASARAAHTHQTDSYPGDKLDRLWKLTLLQQFHDIIPGSSIRWVYEDSHEQYEQILSELQNIVHDGRQWLIEGMDTSAARCPVVVVNSLSQQRHGLVSIAESQLPPDFKPKSLRGQKGKLTSAVQRVDTDNGAQYITRVEDLSPLGATVLALEADPPPAALKRQAARASFQQGLTVLENRLIRAEFDTAGRLVRLLDKRHDREVVDGARPANQLVLYEDRPNEYDAWNIDVFYSEKAAAVDSQCEIRLVEDGPVRAVVEAVRALGAASRITQRFALCSESARLDFETIVDWHEEHQLLRVLHPVSILSQRATFEIQFGHVERSTHTNTSWDAAAFEVVAHTWADLSEPGYGIALLNNCKYGHSIKENILGLSLLRGARWPDPQADVGEHRFTYSLLPHAGDFRQAGVIQEAHGLNSPLFATAPAAHKGALGKAFSLVSIDAPNVIVDTVKKAEQGDAIVVRMYESHGRRNQATLHVNFPFRSCQAIDLLERPTDLFEVKQAGAKIHLRFTPFAIRTLLFER